jgi:cell division protein FtsA
MANQDIVIGLDIGTTKIAVCVGQVSEGLIHILALTKAPNTGVRKGVVIDVEECVSSISGALEQAERMAGVQLDHAVIGIGGSHIIATSSKGVIAASRTDGEINHSDIDRVLDAARTIALPPNREILHVIPRQYIVDGQEGVKDPTGMVGIRLEAETLVIGGSSSAVKSLTRCVSQAGLGIDALLYSPIATAKALLNKSQRENGVMLLDIGGGTTSLAIYEEGDLIHTAILPIGAQNITNDLAIGLRVSPEAAEKIKLQYGNANKETIRKHETIDLSKFDPTENQKIERIMVAEIIEARIKEIVNLVKDELRSIGKDGMLPAGVVLTGGGTLLDGIVEIMKEEFHLPVSRGIPTLEFSGMVDKLDQPVYATSIGLMLEGLEGNIHPTHNKTGKANLPIDLNTVMDKARGLFKQLLP